VFNESQLIGDVKVIFYLQYRRLRMAQEPIDREYDGYDEVAELECPRAVFVIPIRDTDGVTHDFLAAPPSCFRLFRHPEVSQVYQSDR